MKKLYFLFFLAVGFVAQAQIVNIPDANFKAKLLSANSSNFVASTVTPVFDSASGYLISNSYTSNTIDVNGDGEIQVSEAQAIKFLNVNSSNISDLTGIEAFTNLEVLHCLGNQLTSMNLTNLNNLLHLQCHGNPLLNLDFTGLSNLQLLGCGGTNSQLVGLNLSTLTNLVYLYFTSNQLGSLDVSNCTNLKVLTCSNIQLTNLDVSTLTNLEKLQCDQNQLTSLDVSQNVNLKDLVCNTNQLISLDVTQNLALEKLSCVGNQLTSLDVSNNTALEMFNCGGNQFTSLDVSSLANLIYLFCGGNQLTDLNVSQNVNLKSLICNDNQLISVFAKNNNSNWVNIDFSNNPNIEYICVDQEDINLVQNKINQYGLSTTCHVNTYCTFMPGGVFYEISGQAKFDSNTNGCDIDDVNYSNLKFSITDGVSSSVFIADTSGSYYMPVGAGIHTVTPVLTNPTYYTISSPSFTVDFPTQASPFTQDFCITKTGVHSDVEISIIQNIPARPGFDAKYTLIYRNLGTEVESGSVTLTYDDSVLDYVQSNPVYSSTATNSFTWNYTNLQPFESRAITIEFNVNSPMETPAVNNGDILVYNAIITTQNTDETPADNTITLNQTVVGSYDPNDKTCLEGETINPLMIGEYVHYVIRFENTGTYPAENIVVRDDIDTTKFDIATLVPLSASHEFYTRINGNKVEFIFENINLDFDDATNDGYVAFKIKTLSTLTVNSTISNTAKIYFDYNYPIVTNTATSTYQVLNAQSFEFDSVFTLYPNPAKEVLHLQVKNSTAIQSIEIYNIVGQLVLGLPNASTSIDVSSLESGTYFMKINTDNGITATKFIKE
ncbi:T9SS type A sorting domain-containing protein [Flavobacterium chuncheonense]|uniref:T9SS type A sorting domain-containing protein n=1 Tax=Flavobacterium chuncheonense TaxID=2026653 RepID=A0ABW5YJB9_9FLAO